MNHVLKTALLIALTLGLTLLSGTYRSRDLDKRPMHGDEANQAVRTGILLDEGRYHYDPTDHHGPVLYYAAVPFCRWTAPTFAETTEANFRWVPLTFSLMTLLFMLGLYSPSGHALFRTPAGVLAAVALTALSPAMNYYSRFFIQESMFVTFLTGMLVCATVYFKPQASTRQRVWATLGFGAFVGLAAATKETVVLSIAAALLALPLTCSFTTMRRAWSLQHAVLAIGAAAVVAALFFSSFFTYPQGLYDALFATVKAYFSRATAVPEHQHPWHFYLALLFGWKYGRGPLWTELGPLTPLILIAVASGFAHIRKTAQSRDPQTTWTWYLLLYTVILAALYSAIPYKTPWCMLAFLHGFILLAAVGADRLVHWIAAPTAPKIRRMGGLVVVLLALFLVRFQLTQSDRACFRLAADPRNPYVYAHTGTDALNLVAEINQHAQKLQGFKTPIAVAAPPADTWPLPWYLRKYETIGYWQHAGEIPAEFKPAILIVAADQGDVADQRFGAGKQATFYGIRPGVLLTAFLPK